MHQATQRKVQRRKLKNGVPNKKLRKLRTVLSTVYVNRYGLTVVDAARCVLLVTKYGYDEQYVIQCARMSREEFVRLK